MSKLLPGKGFHGTLTKDVADFLHNSLEEIWNSYGDDGDELLDAGNAGEILRRLRGSAVGWRYTKDSFGEKLYKEIPFGTGTYRVTVVITERDKTFAIDIRVWFDPDANA